MRDAQLSVRVDKVALAPRTGTVTRSVLSKLYCASCSCCLHHNSRINHNFSLKISCRAKVNSTEVTRPRSRPTYFMTIETSNSNSATD